MIDLNAEWNQNILRNLRNKHPELKDVDDILLIERFNEWSSGAMGSEDDPDFVEYLKGN